MKLVLVLMFASSYAFSSDFICSAQIKDQENVKSTLSIDGYWYSSTTYSGQKLDYPKLSVDLEVDGRVPNQPNVIFKLKKGRKVLKTFTVKEFGKIETYKLGKKELLEFQCS